jgi:branched-chain amino acid transport system permease protein
VTDLYARLAYPAELAANGALLGLMYALVALGIVLVYKSSAVANLAHGSLVMLGAFVTWAITTHLRFPLGLALVAAVLVMAAVGVGIERLALRRMVGQPLIMILMLTLGLEIMLRGLAPAIWGASSKPFSIGIGQDPFFVADLLINRVYLAGGVLALVLMLLLMLLFRTRLGVVLRAVSDDYVASWSVGISVERAIGLTWALAGGLATLAGGVWASVQGIDWTLSLLLLKALAVAILGGLDSIGGAVVAGLLVGVLESVISGYLDPLVGGGTKEVVAAVVILLTILFKPHGLFGREIIERV